MDYPSFDVFVVDNGSTDNSLSVIRASHPECIYLENGENLGFAEGNNRGMQEAIARKADLLLLLNNDTLVDPQFLSEIVSAAKKNPDTAVFGPKIYFHDAPEVIWFAGASVDRKTGKCYHIGCAEVEGHDDELPTDYVCGCALAVRTDVAEQVGLLSPDYFLIWEEIDWCWRIRKAGHFCLYVPQAKIWHKVSSSFVEGNRGPMWQYYYHRNRLLFHKKHTKWRMPKKELLSLIKKSFSPSLPSKQRKRHRAALLGVLDYHLGRFGKGRLATFIQSKKLPTK